MDRKSLKYTEKRKKKRKKVILNLVSKSTLKTPSVIEDYAISMNTAEKLLQ